jgi:hypothetical protein
MPNVLNPERSPARISAGGVCHVLGTISPTDEALVDRLVVVVADGLHDIRDPVQSRAVADWLTAAVPDRDSAAIADLWLLLYGQVPDAVTRRTAGPQITRRGLALVSPLSYKEARCLLFEVRRRAKWMARRAYFVRGDGPETPAGDFRRLVG